MGKHRFTEEELLAVMGECVSIGRRLERCALVGELELIHIKAMALGEKAEKAGKKGEAQTHLIAGSCYHHLRTRLASINTALYETGCTMAPVESRLETLVAGVTEAIEALGGKLGMGKLVEVTCGCCGIKMICSEEMQADRCPRCIDHKGPEKVQH